jgi:hypothetical protein
MRCYICDTLLSEILLDNRDGTVMPCRECRQFDFSVDNNNEEFLLAFSDSLWYTGGDDDDEILINFKR